MQYKALYYLYNRLHYRMSKSIHSTTLHFDKQKLPRFRCLDKDHIQALESVFKTFSFLNERVEIHMPFHRAKNTFTSNNIWIWQKFDKRPVGYLIFIEGFAPCIWYPERQEGMTFRWLLPPNFCQNGPTVCLANILAGESILQIEDIVIYEGNDLWSTIPFSKRWNYLSIFWNKLPSNQPLLAFKPRIVKPLTIEEWEQVYDPSQYWIIQHDNWKCQRWYWKDTVTAIKKREYISPTLQRKTTVTTLLSALCKPYSQLNLPDNYQLYSQEGCPIGIASISTMYMSIELKKCISEKPDGVVVEVDWNEDFSKYKIIRILPDGTPISTLTFFTHFNI